MSEINYSDKKYISFPTIDNVTTISEVIWRKRDEEKVG
jgi:hypothetical protein